MIFLFTIRKVYNKNSDFYERLTLKEEIYQNENLQYISMIYEICQISEH